MVNRGGEHRIRIDDTLVKHAARAQVGIRNLRYQHWFACRQKAIIGAWFVYVYQFGKRRGGLRSYPPAERHNQSGNNALGGHQVTQAMDGAA